MYNCEQNSSQILESRFNFSGSWELKYEKFAIFYSGYI